MRQCEFSSLKVDDYVLTLYKGKVVSMRVIDIYDKGGACRSVILKVPDSTATILRHMYSIYSKPVIEETLGDKELPYSELISIYSKPVIEETLGDKELPYSELITGEKA